jgi:hypothetical protein
MMWQKKIRAAMMCIRTITILILSMWCKKVATTCHYQIFKVGMLIRNKKETAIINVDSEDEEEDETVLQYYSDDANDNNDDMSPDDEDKDF